MNWQSDSGISAKALEHWSIVFKLAMALAKTDQCMIEAAKCMFHKLLGEASDDLDRVTSQSREDLRTATTRNTRRDSERKNLVLLQRRWSRNLVLVPRQQA